MKQRYFQMELLDNGSGKEADITIYGDITAWEWAESDVSSYTLSRLLQDVDADTINVHINSYGGDVSEGLAIHNALRNHRANVKTWCDGFACSAASVVFMAGDERIMNSASLLMIHNAWSCAAGNAEELRKAADDLETISHAAANAYRARVNISEEELTEMLSAETWIEAAEAVRMGFATSVVNEPESNRPSQSARENAVGLITWAQAMLSFIEARAECRDLSRKVERALAEEPAAQTQEPEPGTATEPEPVEHSKLSKFFDAWR